MQSHVKVHKVSLPYRSPLWAHRHQIKLMLKQKATWKQITKEMEKHNIHLHLSSVYQFHQRCKLRRKPLPDILQTTQESKDVERVPKLRMKDTAAPIFVLPPAQ